MDNFPVRKGGHVGPPLRACQSSSIIKWSGLYNPFRQWGGAHCLRFLHDWRKVRPIFYFVGTNIAHRFFKPFKFGKVVDRFVEIAQIAVDRKICTSLDPIEIIFLQAFFNFVISPVIRCSIVCSSSFEIDISKLMANIRSPSLPV